MNELASRQLDPAEQPASHGSGPDVERSAVQTRAWSFVVWGMVVAAGTLWLLVVTGPLLTITWDEAFVLGREARVRDWVRALRDPSRFAASWKPLSLLDELLEPDGGLPPSANQVDRRDKLLEQPVLEWFWPFARAMPYGHPPGCAIVGLMGDVLAPSWETLARARLGPMVLVSLVSGALFSFVARRWGWWAGVATAGAWILQPRLFGHWHYAHFDNVLVSLWVASVLAFAKAVERDAGDRGSRWPRWPWVLLFGVLWGGAAGTKLTGWFLPFPYLAWVLLYRSRRGFIALLLGGLVAVVVLYAMIPPWWQNPVAGVERFLRSNLTRDLSTKIPTLFLGEIYLTPAGSLPWYNTLVWTLFVTPVGFLILALLGVSRAVRRGGGDPICGLAVIHWAFLLGLRALPHTPGHDGERQFLAAFGLLALAAGAGAAGAIERLGRWGKGLVIAAVVEGAVSLAVMMPFLLSYYSPVVGGLPGAVSLGMEATYYWDSLTDEAIEWLNTHTKPGEKVVFPTYPTAWRYLRQSGKLHPATQYQDPGRWAWYVVQNRGGALGPVDHELIDRIGPEHVLVSKFGVPLLWVFPYRELERARSVVEGKPGVR